MITFFVKYWVACLFIKWLLNNIVPLLQALNIKLFYDIWLRSSLSTRSSVFIAERISGLWLYSSLSTHTHTRTHNHRRWKRRLQFQSPTIIHRFLVCQSGLSRHTRDFSGTYSHLIVYFSSSFAFFFTVFRNLLSNICTLDPSHALPAHYHKLRPPKLMCTPSRIKAGGDAWVLGFRCRG